MIINNLLRKLFTKGKSSFFRQNINNLKKTFLSKNPVLLVKIFYNELKQPRVCLPKVADNLICHISVLQRGLIFSSLLFINGSLQHPSLTFAPAR